MPEGEPRPGDVTSGADLGVGVAASALYAALHVGKRLVAPVRPVRRLVLRHDGGLARRLATTPWAQAAADRGAAERASVARRVTAWLDRLVPVLVDELLHRVELTELVRRNVDLNRVIEGVDLDAAVARVDLDQVAARLDLDAVVGRVDLDLVVRRIDMDAVMDRLDLTTVVLERVDLDLVMQRVLDNLDLPTLTEQVLDAIEFPDIIREASGAMASDTVRDVRLHGVVADQAVSRAIDRLFRHGPRPSESPA
jgi:hypothetical protein